MTIEEIKKNLNNPEYDFLKTNEHLGNKICLLTLGGSHAYGLSTPTSDVDIRGIAVHSFDEIFGLHRFEQVVETNTDTTIYSISKIFELMSENNPNTIEILGCLPEHYIYLNDIGKEILNNKHLFISKKAIGKFHGFASAQLARLENYVCREKLPQPKQEEHILGSVESAMRNLREKYAPFDEDAIKLYIDKAVNEDMETEIFMDCNLKHYPLRDYKMMWGTMNEVVKTYKVVGHTNHKKDDAHLNKHIMHLIRLLLMLIDLLRDCEIVTYRGKDRDFLMSIRNGRYMNEDGTINPELYVLINDLKSQIKELELTTKLPDKPYYKDIEKLLIKCNKMSLDMLS